MNTFLLAIKSVIYRRKQYFSLILVSFFGVGISLFISFLMKGMLDSLRYKAKIYYGGDLQLLGETAGLNQTKADDTIEKIRDIFPEDVIFAKRFDFDADYAAFYFEGTGVRQRVIKGIDFNVENELFENLNFSSGGIEGMAGSNGVLLSEPIAKMLEVNVGDEITFMLRNINWVLDTRTLVVKGIFKDSSVFGMYTSYMDFDYLTDAYAYPDNWCNRVCMFFPRKSPSQKQIETYQRELEKRLNMFHLVEDKQLFYNQLTNLNHPAYALIKLDANLEDVKIIIEAMKVISVFVIFMLIAIIIIGISSTYRVIVMKRINEIGIFKALGFRRNRISLMLLLETSMLVLSGCIGGLFFSLILCYCTRFFNLSFIPAFDIFLSNGVLKPLISFGTFAGISFCVIVTTLVAVLFSIRKAVKMPPCVALAVTE